MRWRFVLRAVLVAAVFTGAALLFLPLLLGFAFSWGVTYMPCSGGAGLPPENAERVTFESSELGQPVRAVYAPGANGVTLIIPPTGGSAVDYWRPEYRRLHDYGYGILNYESRRCMGHPISLGYREVGEVGDALAYLESRGDVDMTRVGVYGFSTSGATSIMAGARYPQLAVVMASGGYADLHDYTVNQMREHWFGDLYLFGMVNGYRLLTGLELTVLSPISVIDQIAPRPLLLIYGSREPSLAGGRDQLAAAGVNAELWEVPGAGHGNYYASAPDEYERRVIDFLDTAFGITRGESG